MVKIYIGILFIFMNYSSYSFESAMKLYQKGSYINMIKELQPLLKNKKQKYHAYYLMGIASNKLQEFKDSVQYFTQALKGEHLGKDLYFQLAQAHYAMSNLQESIKYFKLSAKNKIMVQMSYYYIGTISKVLENYHQAIKYLKKISKKNKELFQPAQFELGKIIYEEVAKSRNIKKRIQRYVIPQLERAYNIDDSTSLAKEIDVFLKKILDKHDLNPNKMKNGRVISHNYLNLRFNSSIAHDSNVVYEAENATVRASKKASVVAKGDFTFKYKWLFSRRFYIQPELKANYTYHFEQKVPEVFRNDSYMIKPRVQYGIEHLLMDKMARIEIETNYYYQTRDVNQNHRLAFFGSSLEYAIAERIKLMSFGESVFKIGRKEFKGQTVSVDSITNSFSFSQMLGFNGGHLLMFLLNLDFLNVPLNKTNSTNTYLIRTDYILSDFIWGIKFASALSFSVFNPRRLRPGRGYEKNLSPTLELGKTFFNMLDLNLKYTYTKNYSQNKEVNQYVKHLALMELIVKY